MDSQSILKLEEELKALEDERKQLDKLIEEVKNKIQSLRATPKLEPGQLFDQIIQKDMFAAGYDDSTVVSKSNPIEDKYKLFLSLFEGRPDVHACGYLGKNGKTGYAPSCANQFSHPSCQMRSGVPGKANCLSCPHKSFQTITIDAFANHLKGEDRSSRLVVLGAYPTDGNDLCQFIAADFDGKASSKSNKSIEEPDETLHERALMTATAFRQTCLNAQIPVYLEISRSGKGYHVWLFFSQRVPATKARQLFSKLWTLTMEQNAGLDFSVYDRFFPSQDSLTSKGLQGSMGNLIALPFQGAQAGKEKRTVFLDTELTPYPDQWAFLSKIRRYSLKELEMALKRLSHVDEVGVLAFHPEDEEEMPHKPWEKRKPAAKLTKSDFLEPLEVIRANMVHLPKDQLSPKAQNLIRRLATISNPEFYKKQRSRQSVYGIQRIISCSKETEEYLSIPRATEVRLVELLDETGVMVTIVDKTNPGIPLEVSFTKTLRGEQPLAAAALLEQENGVLAADPGFGKTVVGAYLIANKKVNTLVLVNNRELFRQWKLELNELLSISNEPPVRYTKTGRAKKLEPIGDCRGDKKNRSGLVDIATFQSLYDKGDVADFVKDYGMVIVDEAHHVPAYSFEAVMQHVSARYVYGLTGTPSRPDGRIPITYMECGPIRYKTNSKVEAEKRPFGHFLVPRFTNLLRSSIGEERNFNDVLNDLMEDDERNQMIINDVRDALEKGRNPIILTDRTKHVHTLANELESHCENVIVMTGKRSEREKREAAERLDSLAPKSRFAIVATAKYIGEGFDFPRLDTLFLATPIKANERIKQYAGRLHRIYDGKEDVMIYDYIDANIPMLDRMYHERIKGYKAIGYQALISSKPFNDKAQLGHFYDKDDYWQVFKQDCSRLTSEVVISSPSLVSYQISRVFDELSPALLQGIKVTVFTSPLNEHPDNEKVAFEACLKNIKKYGAKVLETAGLHHRIAIIDKCTVWYGGANLLGKLQKSDSMIRFREATVAKALLDELNQVGNRE